MLTPAKKAPLVLEDSTSFEGSLFGSPRSVSGEVVFKTGMVGLKKLSGNGVDQRYLIRRKSVDLAIPLITNLQLAQRFVEALHRKGSADLRTKGLRGV